MRERKIGVVFSTSSSSIKKRLRLTESKKAQVTVFIILGIFLLITVALVILYQQEIISLKGNQLALPESGKVENFITDCIISVGEEALVLAGQQGGFITVPDRLSQDLQWHVPLSPFMSVPFWARGAVIDQPSLELSKQQVDDYIETHVRTCLFNSGAFEESYELIEKGPISSDIEFAQAKTIFNVEWDVLIQDKSGEVVAEVINHIGESEVRFKDMYELADAILDAEMSSFKLEDLTQDLIALEHPLVPAQGIEMSCEAKEWSADEARQALQDMIRINLRELKVEGTEFVAFPKDLPYYQNHYIWDVGTQKEGISVEFELEESLPFNFQVTPRSGDTLRSNQLSATENIPFVCIQNWKFTYDVVYPVVVKVVDDNTGTKFQMAMSVHLIRNFPNRGSEIIVRESELGAGSLNEEFCQENNYYVPMEVQTFSEVDNPLNGVYSREALDGVAIEYNCLRYSCPMGETQYNFASRGNAAGIFDVFPYCSAAIVRGSKEGHTEEWEYVVPEENKIIELGLKPLYEIPLSKISIQTHSVSTRTCSAEETEEKGKDATCYDIGNAIPLVGERTAMLTLQTFVPNEETLAKINAGEDLEEEEEPSFLATTIPEGYEEIHKEEIVISPSFVGGYLEETNAQFLAQADFTYDLQIHLVGNDALLGGYQADWTPSWSALSGANEIVFHVIDLGARSDEEIFSLMASLKDISLELPEPELR